jgi:site-specific DNA recombinase
VTPTKAQLTAAVHEHEAHPCYPPVLVASGRPGKRAAIYTRISQDRYGQGEGVQDQCVLCAKLAAVRDLDVVGYYEDNDKSAMRGKRPRYEALMQDVEAGLIDVILVVNADRLYRQLKDLLSLTKVLKAADVPVFSVRSGDVDLATADGRMYAGMKGVVAQHESDLKAERLADACMRRAAKGRYGGGLRRFGYEHRDTRMVYLRNGEATEEIERPTGPLVLVPDEAEAIAWAYEHVAAGGSLGSVKRKWTEDGLLGVTGAPFVDSAVKDILLRPMNAGLTVYKGDELGTATELGRPEDVPPAIIDVETWRVVVALLGDPSRKTYAGRPPVSLLAPMLRCSLCLAAGPEAGTARMSGASKTITRADGERFKYLIYACRAKGHLTRRREALDEWVSAEVVARVMAQAAAVQRPAPRAAALAGIAAEAEALRRKLARYKAAADDYDNPADHASAVNTVRAALALVERKIIAASGQPATSALVESGDVPAAWEALSVDSKREVIAEQVDSIVVGRGPTGHRPDEVPNLVFNWKDEAAAAAVA